LKAGAFNLFLFKGKTGTFFHWQRSRQGTTMGKVMKKEIRMNKNLIVALSLGLLILAAVACSPQETTSSPVVDTLAPSLESTATQPPQPPTELPSTESPSFPVVDAPQLLSMRFFDGSNGWGMTSTNVLRTEDGGTTWLDVSPAGVTDLGFGAVSYFYDASHGWLAISNPMDPAESGRLFRTSDGGASWAESTLPPSMGGRFSFIDPTNGFFMADLGAGAGSNWVGIYSTTDAGATWVPEYVPEPGMPESEGALPGSGQKSGMTFLDTSHGWVTGNIPMDNYLYLYNSSDGGSTWSAQSGPIPTDFGTVFTNTYPPVFFDQKGIMPVTLFSNVINLVIYTSNNGGETWTAAPAPVANAGRGELVDFVNPTDGFAWATGRFAVTHDAAQNWDTVTPSIPFGDNFMAMDFVNTSTGWVLTMNADSHTSLYQTTDGGTNWITLIP
jgi:photosystem II stability/assembly factor-like uncharacterized protein